MRKLNYPQYFLGPKSELRPFMLEMVNLILNDYLFWRRNYYPKDPTALSYRDTISEVNNEFKEECVNELFKLLADLKIDPPFFSPRYMAHMISETALPGMLAYMATMLYNPNNISSEASPVTIQYEQIVAKQFAELFGFNPDHIFGHLTSGGTVANYQSLYFNKLLRLLPLTFAMFLKKHNVENSLLKNKSVWQLCNISYDDYDKLIESFIASCIDHNLNPDEHSQFSIYELGDIDFEKTVLEIFGQQLPSLKVVVPASAHYSWSRGVKLIGLGKNNIVKIKLNSKFQMSEPALEKYLAKLEQNNEIVIQLVCVFGTTEFGTFDSIDSITTVREKIFSQYGSYAPIHVDAAYGGYFATIFAGRENKKFTSQYLETLKSDVCALKKVESITVDPHKLGFTPYGAGAFIFKHGALKKFLAESAAYVFNKQAIESGDDIQIGKFILEGSRPGAAAASVYFNHKMIPLEHSGYGRLLEDLCHMGNIFSDELNKNKNSRFTFIVISPLQSNIVCFNILDSENNSLTHSNELVQIITKRFGVKHVSSIQEYDYIVSNTTIDLTNLEDGKTDTFNSFVVDTNEVKLVRCVFLNQWHNEKNSQNITYIQDFVQKMTQELERTASFLRT